MPASSFIPPPRQKDEGGRSSVTIGLLYQYLLRCAVAEDNEVETGRQRHRLVALHRGLLYQHTRGRVDAHRRLLRGVDADRTAVRPYGRLIYQRIGHRLGEVYPTPGETTVTPSTVGINTER